MKSILHLRLQQAGKTRWKSGLEAAIQHAEMSSAEPPAADEPGTTTNTILRESFDLATSFSRITIDENLDSQSEATVHISVTKASVPVGAACENDVESEESDEEDMGLPHRLGGKRVIMCESEESEESDLDDDHAFSENKEYKAISNSNTCDKEDYEKEDCEKREHQGVDLALISSGDSSSDGGDDDIGMRRNRSRGIKRAVICQSEESQESDVQDVCFDADSGSDIDPSEGMHFRHDGREKELNDANSIIDLTNFSWDDGLKPKKSNRDYHMLPIVPDEVTNRGRHIKRSKLSSEQRRLTPAKWKRRREALTTSLFHEFNETVFDGKLPQKLSIKWNSRLLRTAGLTHMRVSNNTRMARVELASKVLTDEIRLKSTLLHELCHVAAWLVDGVRKPPHGPIFKKWGRKCTKTYPSIQVTTCHSYDIQYKYTYICENHPKCGWKVGRHSKSIDTEQMCCGRCHGAIVLQPQLKPDGTPRKARKPTAYEIYNKQQHALLKDANMTFKEKTKLISQMWKRQKENVS